MKPHELPPEDQEVIRMMADYSLNVSWVARKLFLHRNTVHYRLNRIKESTGIDPRTFWGLMELIVRIGGAK